MNRKTKTIIWIILWVFYIIFWVFITMYGVGNTKPAVSSYVYDYSLAFTLLGFMLIVIAIPSIIGYKLGELKNQKYD